MDKTIEVVLVAVVVIATAAIMLFIFTGEAGSFSDFLSGETDEAACELAVERCDQSSWESRQCGELGYNSPQNLQECQQEQSDSCPGEYECPDTGECVEDADDCPEGGP